MQRFVWTMVGVCLAGAGCWSSTPEALTPIEQAPALSKTIEPDASPKSTLETSDSVEIVDSTTDPVLDDVASPLAGDRIELRLEGISFFVPPEWRKVRPPNKIIEAEFELPPPDGTLEPARLTLMASGGNPQDVIALRTAEFITEPGHGPRVEMLKIGERTLLENKVVDEGETIVMMAGRLSGLGLSSSVVVWTIGEDVARR